MFIPDLDTTCYFASGHNLRATGWLEKGFDYQTGTVTEGFLKRLKEHVAKAYQPVMFFGVHGCSLCPPERRTIGANNVLIPTKDRLYVAPELVAHYIEQHGYMPPHEFIEAVMNCPDQETQEYLRLLKPFEYSWER